MNTVISCRVCGLQQRLVPRTPDAAAFCCRCGACIHEPRPDGLRRTLAFSLAALILYLPANLYPILRMEWYGAYAENTVWQGSVRLFEYGQWLVAIIVFLASILIPLLKLLGLFYLSATTRYRPMHRRRERTWVYRAITVIGPWAMLDVFLLAIMVSLVKLGELATILPGSGLVAFTAVVVLTILASASFDPRLIWEEAE
jgi:paraquat-inducible protein A